MQKHRSVCRTVQRLAAALLLVVCSAAARSPRVEAQEPATALQALQESLQKAIARGEPAMVAVAVLRSSPSSPLPVDADPFEAIFAEQPGGPVPSRFGGGVILDRDEAERSVRILTAAHLVEPAFVLQPDQPRATIAVRTPLRQTALATVLAADPRSGLAVLKATFPEKSQFPKESLAPGRAELLEKGTLLVGLGNPWGLARDGSCSASLGMVSNLSRTPPLPRGSAGAAESLAHLGLLLQVDLQLDPGMSGGILLNLEGEMTGMVAALPAAELPGHGATLAIPFHAGIRRVIESLKQGLEVEYGFLGVSAELGTLPDDPELARLSRTGTAAVVNRVASRSPGDRAGLRPDDLILSVGGEPVEDGDDLTREIALLGPGTRVSLEVYSPSRRFLQNLTVELGKWPLADDTRLYAANWRYAPWRGLRVDYPTARRQFLPDRFLSEYPEAVVITEVLPGSPAAQAGLKVGEFIAKVGEQPVETPAKFYELVEAWPERAPITLRGGTEVLLPPTPLPTP